MTNEQIKQGIKRIDYKTIMALAECLVSVRCSDKLMMDLLDELYRIEAFSKHPRPILVAHRLRKMLISEWVKE